MGLGKWIGGGLGWVFGGPIGALVGVVLGSILDGTTVVERGSPQLNTAYNFNISLIVLLAHLMKADGKVVKSELAYVKHFFDTNFGSHRTPEYLIILRDVLKKEYDLAPICQQIRENLDYKTRLHMMHMLFNLAKADGNISISEKTELDHIANWLYILDADYASISNMFIPANDWAFKILEIEKTATPEDIKKAYKKMVFKYHPDKVSHLGEEHQLVAHEKIVKVNEAYNTLKKEHAFQ